MKKLIAMTACVVPLMMSPVAFGQSGGDAGTVSNSQPGSDTSANTGNDATRGGSMDTMPRTPGGYSTNDTGTMPANDGTGNPPNMNEPSPGERQAQKSDSTQINGNNGTATGEPRSQSGSK